MVAAVNAGLSQEVPKSLASAGQQLSDIGRLERMYRQQRATGHGKCVRLRVWRRVRCCRPVDTDLYGGWRMERSRA